jgi:hypothetical protein
MVTKIREVPKFRQSVDTLLRFRYVFVLVDFQLLDL